MLRCILIYRLLLDQWLAENVVFPEIWKMVTFNSPTPTSIPYTMQPQQPQWVGWRLQQVPGAPSLLHDYMSCASVIKDARHTD